MALTSSTLKTLIKSEVQAKFGTIGEDPNKTPAEAHDEWAEAVAKAVVKWIAANGAGSVSGVDTGPGTATLNATDDL